MSYNATTTSSPSSLSPSIVDDTSRPSSTRPEAGWGSPSPVPDSFPPVSLATVLTPIHSVTIPLYAHTLRNDFPNARDIKKLSDYLRSPAFALSIDSFLDIGSPLYALRRAYLKNSLLRLMSTNISPSPQQTVLSRLIREVYLEIEGSLVMAMYQLGMLEFLEDIDRYMMELSRRNSPDSSSSFVTALSTCTTSSTNISASSSPLVSDEERVLQRVESWWTGGNSQVPLPSTHPCYHQACHSCHRLGHYRNQCPVYQCPSCTRWAPGHNPNHCPLRRRPIPHSPSDSSPTTSRRSSGSSRRSLVLACIFLLGPTVALGSELHIHQSGLVTISFLRRLPAGSFSLLNPFLIVLPARPSPKRSFYSFAPRMASFTSSSSMDVTSFPA